MQKKYVIYTSLTGGYDKLPQYKCLDERFDYICYSNDFNEGEKIGMWEIRNIPLTNCKDNIRLSRYVKLQPHKVLSEYEYSLWIDSNIIVEMPLFYDIVIGKIREGKDWYGIKHPLRDCIYEDAEAVVLAGVANFFEIRKQMKFLRSECYPEHYGLFENNIILRKHNSEVIREINDDWWQIYNRFSKRDQMSLFYIFWQHSFTPSLLLPPAECSRNVDYLTYRYHKNPSILKRIKNRLHKKFNKIMNRMFSPIH